MGVSLGRILSVMEHLAPPELAEEWDNIGLQIGSRDWQIDKVLVALDPSLAVVDEACKKNIGLLITHHPLIFRPFKKIDLSSPTGLIIQKVIERKIAIYSAHTNLDSAAGGLNDILCAKLGLERMRPLVSGKSQVNYKLVVFVPAGHESAMLDAMFQGQAGRIGTYDCCTFRSRGTGTFRPGRQSRPFIGKAGEISHVDEYRLETIVSQAGLDTTIQKIKQASPYETVAYDLYPVMEGEPESGLGRVGQLPKPMDLGELAGMVKRQLDLKVVKVAGKPSMPVRKAAVCSGSGASLINTFLSSDADVYISGDFRYHDAQTIEAHGRGLIDIGHFESEHIIVDNLVDRIKNGLAEFGDDIQVEASTVEQSPFFYIQ